MFGSTSELNSPEDLKESALFSSLIRRIDLSESFHDQQKHIEQLLFRCLNTKTVVALVGSGCSLGLGYPNWKKFAEEILQIMLPPDKHKQKDIKRLISYITSDNGLPDYITYRTIFSECRRICRPQNSSVSEKFLETVQKFFLKKHNEAEDKRGLSKDCYGPLIDLPIKRFITTNYDLELEMALLSKGKATCIDLFGKDYDLKNLSGEKNLPLSNNKSFTQCYSCREQLSQFSLARNEASQYMIFTVTGALTI